MVAMKVVNAMKLVEAMKLVKEMKLVADMKLAENMKLAQATKLAEEMKLAEAATIRMTPQRLIPKSKAFRLPGVARRPPVRAVARLQKSSRAARVP